MHYTIAPEMGHYMFISNKVAPQFLLPFNGLEQGLEVAGAEAGKVISLDNLDEDRGAIEKMLEYPLARPREMYLREKDEPW